MIYRTGPATTLVCKMRVPLTDTPSPAWREAFHAAAHSSSGATGSLVGIVDGDIVFACDPRRVEQAVADIDEWIATANGETAGGPAPLHRATHAGHRDLTWQEQRVVSEAARRADVLKEF